MSTISLKVTNANEMSCFVSEPAEKPRAAVIVLMEAFGVNTHVKDLARRFSELGYLAIAPELYHRTAPVGWTCAYTDFASAQEHFAGLSEDGMIADVQACYDWISKEKGVSAVGTTGYCLGGRVSFLANSQVPLKAAVSYYGGRIAPNHIHLAKKQIAPLLFFWGGKDTHIPKEQIDTVMAALTEAGKTFTNILISDADHGFFTDDKASYNPTASKLAWSTTLEFFKINLV